MAVLEGRVTGPMAWEHHSVPLAEFNGGIVRIVLFQETPVEGYLLVSDLRVLDGGDPLVGDRFGPQEVSGQQVSSPEAWDGWTQDDQLDDRLEIRDRNGHFGAVISSMGSLGLAGSQFNLAQSLPRTQAHPEAYTKGVPGSVYVGGINAQNYLSALRGGHVEANDGTISVRDCAFHNVPVVAAGTDQIELARTTFEGGTDLVTLVGPNSNVEGCRFVSEPLPSVDRGRLFGSPEYERFLWSLSIDGGGIEGEERVQNCSFEGGEVALDLNRADVKITGCTFSDISQLAIWDHESTNGWNDVGSSNRFDACTGDRYLETRSAELDVRFRGGSYRATGTDPLLLKASEVIKDPSLPDITVVEQGYGEWHVCVPVRMVDALGSERGFEKIPIVLPLGMGSSKVVELDTDVPGQVVDILVADLSPDLMLALCHSEPFGHPTVGAWLGYIQLMVQVDCKGASVSDRRVCFDLDGTKEWCIDVSKGGEEIPMDVDDPGENIYNNIWVVRKVIGLHGGGHSVRVTYTEYDVQEARYVEGMNLTYHFYRITGEDGLGNLTEFLTEHEDCWIVVDPDVVLIPDTQLMTVLSNRSAMRFLLFNGSRVDIEGQPVGTGPLDVTAVGEGTLNFHETYRGNLTITSEGGNVNICNISSQVLSIDLQNGSCAIGNASCGSIDLKLAKSAHLTLEDSSIDSLDENTTSLFDLSDSRLRLSNVAFDLRNGGSHGLDISIRLRGASELCVNGSRFSYHSIALVHDGGDDWGLEVLGCTFSGSSVLSLDETSKWPWSTFAEDPGNVTGSIDGNAFFGPSSGLVVMGGHYKVLGRGNSFSDGAWLLVHFRPHILVNVGPRTCDYEIVNDGRGMAGTVIGSGLVGGGYDVFIDLEGNASQAMAPREVTIMVITTPNRFDSGGAWWFMQIDPRQRSVTLDAPDWGATRTLISEWRNK